MNIEKYRNIFYETRKCCEICGNNLIDIIINMPDFPLSEIYINHKIEEKLATLNQSFCYCSNCGHGQIMNVIHAELQYSNDSDYYFRTSKSISGRESTDFFIEFFNKVVKGRTFQTIIEIGCNDLYLLKSLRSSAVQLIGVDPILKGNEEEIYEDKIIAIGAFFENIDLNTNLDVVICKDTLEHVSHPKLFLQKIIEKATDKTLFFFQFPILDTLLSNCRFDQVFHQHLNYFSLKSLMYLLNQLGCGILDYTINYDHWGALLICFKKDTGNYRPFNSIWNITYEEILDRYKSFEIDMEQSNKRLEYFKNENLYGYGAALMLPILSYYLKNDLNCLECIIDDDENKDGLYYINLPIPIKHISHINDINKSVVLLTAISSKINTKRIMTKLFSLNPKYIIYPLRTF